MCLYQRFIDCSDFYYGSSQYNPIEKPDEGWNFIIEYFKLGQKEIAFDLKFFDKLKKDGKHIHSISMYYLGCVLKDLIEEKLIDTLEVIAPKFVDSFNYKFSYSWFLTCLYHDTAWVIENEDINNADFKGCAKYYLDSFLKQHEVSENVYSHNWIGEKHYTYSKPLVEKYFYYCLAARNKVDHGIIGGFILYDRLFKNYHNNWEKYKSECADSSKTWKDFEYKDLSWKQEHLDHFAYIANAIISHNIWYDSNKELYKRYGLKRLIESDNNKITLEKDPLVFFLALIDTIEPTKFFYMFEKQYVWKNIDIEYTPGTKEITIQLLDEILCFDAWFKKIKPLKDWLNVEVKNPNNRTIVIRIF